ncbi:uncharacterized protein LOC134039632 [Osmerus eperlanus]|uniref:uncharacterized protein LOC134039632 n=1 Tax=Osmerus eperlanus TaxID=29151 RepID=UPI002E12FE9F
MMLQSAKSAPFLLPLLQKLALTSPTHASEPYRPLLTQVSKNSPACALLRPSKELGELMSEMEGLQYCQIERQPALLGKLAKECPLFFSLVGMEGTFSQEVVPIFQCVYKKALETVSTPPVSTPLTSPEDPGHYFPNLPPVRDRGTYTTDRCKKEASDCRKTAGRHPNLIPGIFTLFCTHGVCLGFSIMEQVESVNVPFTILCTRFRQYPKIVIYDNACQLQTYCLRRDPGFFRETWFLVDRLHWRNHSGCNIGYNLDSYPQFQKINSQVAEQNNSLLKKMKGQLSYMNRENFIRHLMLFLWHRSCKVITKL